QITMPLMFGFLTMQWPSGLAIYFVVTNVVSIIIQIIIEMRGGKSFRDVFQNLSPRAAEDTGTRGAPSKRRKK
ncbi:MAG: hypothetical protein SVX38_15935, partial [Chloroflexota bacterium]|nr:hypothetical protein [Chloroflexota bacterium]